MISKELLSKVLGLDCGVKRITRTDIAYWFDCIGEIRESNINVYELAHKCKEWAREYQDYNLITLELRGKWLCVDWYNQSKNISSKCNTEPEAIFKACEWILQTYKDKQ